MSVYICEHAFSLLSMQDFLRDPASQTTNRIDFEHISYISSNLRPHHVHFGVFISVLHDVHFRVFISVSQQR